MTEEVRRNMKAAYHKAQALLTAAEADDRMFTRSEQAQFREATAHLEHLRSMLPDGDKSIDELLADLEGQGTRHTPPPPVALRAGMLDKESDRAAEPSGPVFQAAGGELIRSFAPNDEMAPHAVSLPDGIRPDELDIGRMIRGQVLGDWRGAEAERRALGEGTGALGGFLVPDSLSARLIDLARNKTRCVQAGAITLPMQTPELHLIRVESDPTAYWREENTAITESDPGFERVTLRAMACAALVRSSVELIEDSPASAIIRHGLAKSLAQALDLAALMGSGGNEPRGIFNTEGVAEVSMGTNGAAPTSFDEFSQAVQTIQEANEEPNAVIFAPRTAGQLDRLKEGTTNAPLPAPASFRGLRKLVTGQVPIDLEHGTATDASPAFVGDFSNLAFGVRTRLAVDVVRTGETDSFSKMQLLIRAFLRADVAVLRPSAFCMIKGITEA